MDKSELLKGYSMFGNKGDVFNGTVHICKDGLNPDTLCGRPMLSTNHAAREANAQIGCAECIEIHNDQRKPEWFANSEYYKQMQDGTHGSFARSLSETWRLADSGNRRSLVEAFPQHFKGYGCY